MSDDTRVHGVDFGDLANDLEAASYPMEKEAVVDQFGDRELEFTGEETTVRETLAPMGETTFDSADEVEQSLLSMVDDDAVGREEYSDRGSGTTPDDDTDASL
jgi:hypothetical protein